MLKKAIRNIILKCTAYLFNNPDSKVLFYHDVHCGAQYTEMSTTLKKFQKHKVKKFINDFEILSVLRNLKIIGIFMRLEARDNKKKYKKMIPYAWQMINYRMKNNIEFKNLKSLLKSNFPKFIN